MLHALSTHLFVNHRLTTAALERIWRAGIPAVELFFARQHLDWTDQAQIAELGHFFRDCEMKVHSVHAPLHTDDVWGRSGPHAVLSITETVKSKRIPMVDQIKRAIEFAETVPFRYLIQHIGVPGEEYDDRKVEAAFTALEDLSVFARHRGVEILLENTPNALSSAERLVAFLDETHLHLGLCFDTGHAHLHEGIEAAFGRMKPRVRSTHIHDNDGGADRHLFPFFAAGRSIDWAHTMAMLRACGEQFPLLLELKEAPEFPHPLETVQEVFERLENIS
ncbi:MAG: sugar phosphate isomerase/epimerase [Acidobacteria bacterium]|nr:sugar phosphate isomerase/epimerase [Acidobacteriota bacterium]